MSKVIVPIHLGPLGAIPSPSSVQPGFKLLYLRVGTGSTSGWLKIYDGLLERDVVLDRPLDNFLSKPGTVTPLDTVLSAIEKLQNQISSGSGGVIDQDNELYPIFNVRIDRPLGDTVPYATLVTNWLLTQTIIVSEKQIPYFTFLIIYDNDLANSNNLKVIYLWGEGKDTVSSPPITSLRLISASPLTLSDIGGGNVITYNLGVLLPGEDFIDNYINLEPAPGYDFHEDLVNPKEYLVNFIQDGVDYFYHFVGPPAYYGVPPLEQAIPGDFILLNQQPQVTRPYVKVTYAELTGLISSAGLELDMTYLLTDYVTTYNQPPETGTGPTTPKVATYPAPFTSEPLYLKAVAIDKLHPVGRSGLYPEDIIYYSIDSHILEDGIDVFDEGFTKGKIYRRIDTLRNNDIGTDWRHIKYRRGAADLLLFEDYDGVSDNKIKTYTLFNTVMGKNTWGNDLYDVQSNTIGDDFTSNRIDTLEGNTIGVNMYANLFYYFTDNRISDNFSTNKGNWMNDCDVSDNFWYNTITNNLEHKDLTGIAELYEKNYTHTITIKPNNTYQYSYVDNFGDTIIEDIP